MRAVVQVMTLEDLGRFVLEGRLIVAGELRGCAADYPTQVDHKTGCAKPRMCIVYVVERQLQRGMEFIRLSRFYPEPFPEAAEIICRVEKGLRYVFEVVSMKRDRNGLILATMDAVEPVVLEGVAPPICAPPGAQMGGSDA